MIQIKPCLHDVLTYKACYIKTNEFVKDLTMRINLSNGVLIQRVQNNFFFFLSRTNVRAHATFKDENECLITRKLDQVE